MSLRCSPGSFVENIEGPRGGRPAVASFRRSTFRSAAQLGGLGLARSVTDPREEHPPSLLPLEPSSVSRAASFPRRGVASRCQARAFLRLEARGFAASRAALRSGPLSPPLPADGEAERAEGTNVQRGALLGRHR
ncbi:hypothetical protein KM043_000195 [Ampulex compressa]|nr:hypothetical protein KM043_000195 [Ampulex compressa]